MAISSEVFKVIYAGDDTSTTFPYTFKIFDQAEIEVIKYTIATGVETVLTIGTHYTVSGVGVDAGGNVTLVSALLDEYDLILRRKVPYKQEVDWEQNGDFSTDVLEEVEDRAVQLIQQLKEILNRAVLQNASKIAPLTLPLPVAGKALGWDPTGAFLINDPADFATTVAAVQALVVLATNAKNDAVTAKGLAQSAQAAADADVLLTHADVLLTHADVLLTAADRVQTALDRIATGADRTQTGLDKIATAADRVQTGLDKSATNADVVLTHADVVLTHADVLLTHADVILTHADAVQTALDRIAAAASAVNASTYAAALKGTSTSSLAIATGSKTFTTQAGKQFAAGMFILATSDADPTNYMHGQVTSYTGTTLVINVLDIGGSGTKADWTISVSGSRGATGATGATGAAGATGTIPIATAAGTVDAITADYTPDLTLANLTLCAFVASGANTSTTPTFAPDGLTAHTIVKKGGSALVAGDIPGAGAVCIVEYNSANTRWELLNPASVPAAGGDMSYADTRMKAGTFTRAGATADGNVSITGLGFTPKMILFVATKDGGTGEFSIGIVTGAFQECIADNYVYVAGGWYLPSANVIFMRQVSGQYLNGNYVSLDADGFTLSFVNTGTYTGNAHINWMAWR